MVDKSKRDFLKTLTTLAAGLAIAPVQALAESTAAPTEEKSDIDPFNIDQITVKPGQNKKDNIILSGTEGENVKFTGGIGRKRNKSVDELQVEVTNGRVNIKATLANGNDGGAATLTPVEVKKPTAYREFKQKWTHASIDVDKAGRKVRKGQNWIDAALGSSNIKIGRKTKNTQTSGYDQARNRQIRNNTREIDEIDAEVLTDILNNVSIAGNRTADVTFKDADGNTTRIGTVTKNGVDIDSKNELRDLLLVSNDTKKSNDAYVNTNVTNKNHVATQAERSNNTSTERTV